MYMWLWIIQNNYDIVLDTRTQRNTVLLSIYYVIFNAETAKHNISVTLFENVFL